MSGGGDWFDLLLGDLPVLCAVEVLDDGYGDGRGFLILDGDGEGLVGGVGALVGVEVGLLALAGNVEGRAYGYFDGFVGGRVVDGAFAGELHLAVGVAAIEADASGGEWHAEMVGGGVFDLGADVDPGVGGGAEGWLVVVVSAEEIDVLLRGGAVVLVDAVHGDGGGFEELDLLGFFIAKRDRAIEVVEVEVVEGLLGNVGSTDSA